MKSDIEIAKEIMDKEFHVTTISWKHLEWFFEECKNGKTSKMNTIRTRFRNALNELYKQGYCDRYYTGTSYYQTSDTLGGKSCLIWTKKY